MGEPDRGEQLGDRRGNVGDLRGPSGTTGHPPDQGNERPPGGASRLDGGGEIGEGVQPHWVQAGIHMQVHSGPTRRDGTLQLEQYGKRTGGVVYSTGLSHNVESGREHET